MKIPIRNFYYLICYAWDQIEESDLADVEALDELERVQDLIGLLLARGIFRLVRRGIDRGYVERTREIAGVRGKLQIAPLATRALKARGRTVCTFEEYSPDVLHNRILRAALEALLRLPDLAPAVRADVALAYSKLGGIGRIRLSLSAFRRVQLDRNQRLYRHLLSLSRLLHDSLLVGEGSGDAKFRDVRRNKHRMWRIFESFVKRFLAREQHELLVQGQRRIPWTGAGGRTKSDRAMIPRMSADVLLLSPRRRVVVDTKFYGNPLQRRHGTPKLRSGNLYQMLAYLENADRASPEAPRFEGLLLYAAVEERLRVDVTLQGFRIRACTVDLNRPWREVHNEMLEVCEISGRHAEPESV